ncbi:MAG: response regulator [Anaerolineaceae bacterium]|nr:response regulator [Anaerolineaceae bacterium]
MNQSTILLVEDNESDAELTQRAMAKNRMTNPLVVVDNGRQALDYLLGQGNFTGEEPPELPALVLLDLNLPGMSGLEVLRQIRAHERTRLLPVIMLTTSMEDHDMTRSYELGANSYIRKPVDYNEFVQTINLIGIYWLEINQPPPNH